MEAKIIVPQFPNGIAIGEERENLAVPVVVDYTAWIELHGAGALQILLQRPQDADPYPVTVTNDNGEAIWTPNETDMNFKGRGEIQLVYTAGDVIEKSPVIAVISGRSLGVSGDAPDPYETWLERLTELAAETQQNAIDAAESAEEAGTSADAASESAGSAAQSALDAEAAKTGAETAEQAAGQSAALARTKAAEAAQAAQTAAQDADYARHQSIAAGDSAASAHDDAESAAQSAEDAQTASSAAQTAATAAGASADSAEAAADEVETKGAEQITAINQAGTTQIAAVDAAGAAQVQAIEDKGEEVIASIPSDYTELADDVSDLKSSFVYTDNWEDKSDVLEWNNGQYWWNGHASTYAKTSWARYGEVKQGDKVRIRARAIGGANALILWHDNTQTVYGPASGYLNIADEYTMDYDGELYINTQTERYLEPSQTNPYKLFTLKIATEKLPHIKTTLSGRKWAVIGDSLCEYNQIAPENWVRDMVINEGAIITNLASSGTGFYRGAELNGSTPTNYIAKIPSIPNDTEFISICGSFNDTMSNPWPALPIGTETDTGNETVAGYMNAFFDALIAAFPTTPIAVAMTSPWDSRKPNTEISDNYVNVLEKICEIKGIPFSRDCYDGCNLKPWITANRDYYYTHTDGTVDGVHPNDKGHILLYNMLKPFFEKCQNKI